MTCHCVMSVATDHCVTPINLHGNGSLRLVVKLMSICSINTHTRNSARILIQIAMFLIIVRLLDLFCVADGADGIGPGCMSSPNAATRRTGTWPLAPHCVTTDSLTDMYSCDER